MKETALERLHAKVVELARAHWPKPVVAALPAPMAKQLEALTRQRALPRNARILAHATVADGEAIPGIAAALVVAPAPDPADIVKLAEAITGIPGGGDAVAALAWQVREGRMREVCARLAGAKLMLLVPPDQPLRMDAPPC